MDDDDDGDGDGDEDGDADGDGNDSDDSLDFFDDGNSRTLSSVRVRLVFSPPLD